MSIPNNFTSDPFEKNRIAERSWMLVCTGRHCRHDPDCYRFMKFSEFVDFLWWGR